MRWPAKSICLFSVTVLICLVGLLLSACNRNGLPVISKVEAASSFASPSEDIEIYCDASDPDGDGLSYTWSTDSGSFTGEGPSIKWHAPESPGTYKIRIFVSDGRGGEVLEDVKIDVANHAPIIQAFSANPSRVDLGGTVVLECIASDPDGDPLTYEWSADAGNVSIDAAGVTWKAPAAAGDYKITVKAKDNKGAETTAQVPVKAVANRPPVITSLVSTPLTIPASGSANVTCVATDPDNDALTYIWSSAEGSFEGSGSEVTWLATENCSVHTLKVEVTDGRGGEATKELNVRVKKPSG